MNLFGFQIKTKEEQKKEEQEYLMRIFPGGLDEKEAVEQELKKRLPKVKTTSAMFYYILIRDAMTSCDGLEFEEAAARVNKKQRVMKDSPEIREQIRQVIFMHHT